ncbi:MAG: hypothetical protein IT459_05095 [Planctomycetes bacterium]|nr:hypothetical protein [Planctomycetota bacterium]
MRKNLSLLAVLLSVLAASASAEPRGARVVFEPVLSTDGVEILLFGAMSVFDAMYKVTPAKGVSFDDALASGDAAPEELAADLTVLSAPAPAGRFALEIEAHLADPMATVDALAVERRVWRTYFLCNPTCSTVNRSTYLVGTGQAEFLDSDDGRLLLSVPAIAVGADQ